jgi:hypothetical protein
MQIMILGSSVRPEQLPLFSPLDFALILRCWYWNQT